MSGGHYNYAYSRIEELAVDIRGSTPLRRAFKKHLLMVAKACHDIEWVDSSDYGPGDEDEAIKKVIGDWEQRALEEVIEGAWETIKELEKAMADAAKAQLARNP